MIWLTNSHFALKQHSLIHPLDPHSSEIKYYKIDMCCFLGKDMSL